MAPEQRRMMDADATQLLALSRVTYNTEQRGP